MNNIEALEKYALSLECSAERGVSMKNYTSFKVGGPAELFLSPEDAGQTAKLVRFCEKEDIPVFVLGKGSNVLVSDKGIKGAVIFTGKQCHVKFSACSHLRVVDKPLYLSVINGCYSYSDFQVLVAGYGAIQSRGVSITVGK